MRRATPPYFSNKKELNIKKYFKGFRPGRIKSGNTNFSV